MVKASSLAATGRHGTGMELFQSLISKALSLPDLSGGSLEDTKELVRLSVFDLSQSLPFPWEALVENNYS